MDKGDIVSSGKTKSLYRTEDPHTLIMHFRDDTTAFNAEKSAKLVSKGIINQRINAHLMRLLEEHGIRTHFIEELNARESLVKRMDMLPIESVVRNLAAGSLCKRLGIAEGQVLKPAVQEFFYKNDALGDPLINDAHILTFGYAKAAQLQRMRELSRQVNQVLQPYFDAAGLLLVDFKLEFGVCNGELLLADEFTPDGCRLWDKETRESLDKDRFRKDLGHVVESYCDVANRLGVDLSGV